MTGTPLPGAFTLKRRGWADVDDAGAGGATAEAARQRGHQAPGPRKEASGHRAGGTSAIARPSRPGQVPAGMD
jgi:hypothetical protein